tara:strand:- start:3 stop:365 length:363 start_codon:yes stop_codon:yes gene_type:complete
MKICQGPKCHTYDTKDRLRGPKGNKVPQTRRRSSFHYLGGNACDMRCERDWFHKFGDQAVNYFGRITQPKKLEERNAWYKTFDWDNSYNRFYVYHNTVTKERRPLTAQQYNDSNYDLNER